MDILQNNWPIVYKSAKGSKSQGKTEELFQSEINKETLQLNVTHDFELNHYKTLGQSVKLEWCLRSRCGSYINV